MIGISLVLVDVQNDFLEGGSLAVPSSSSILPPISSLLASEGTWASIIATQDYHPPNHISFADNHKGAEVFTEIKVDHPLLGCTGDGEKIKQMMWPRHCVRGTHGCEIQVDVRKRLTELREKGEDVIIIRKGDDPKVDGYSGLSDNAYSRFTPLIRYISSEMSISGKKRPSTDIALVVGLATDYCVVSTALDLLKHSVSVYLPLDCIAGVAQETTSVALNQLRSAGAHIFDTHKEAMVAAQEEAKRRQSREGSWLTTFTEKQRGIWADGIK